MPEEITLRPVEPSDGPAIAALGEETPDTGAVAMHTRFEHDPYETLLALYPGMTGVVAETPGRKGIVGLGLVRFGECLYEGQVRPYAYLFSLGVHPEFRRRGIASRIASWRVEAALNRLGDGCVIFAGIQRGNTGSQKAAEAWATKRVDDRMQLGLMKVRTRAPRPLPGVEVRPARTEELEEIAEKQNAFYSEYNLYPPQTARGLGAWLSESPFGYKLNSYYVAVDHSGAILSGMAVMEEGRLLSGQIVRMPPPLRLANLVLRIVPAGGIMNRLSGEQFWFAPGNLEAARYLWEAVRWLCRDRGTILTLFFDPRGPLAQAVTLPRFVPKQTGTLVLREPVPMREERLIYREGR
jgi:GNAT superfamily N-acetyltransferase